MIVIKAKSDCCGCGGCSQVCPKQCIEMKADNEGFLYPSVDKNACVSCGLCERTCPILSSKRNESKKDIRQDAHVAYHLDEAIRLKSSSGGVFTALAEDVIQHGGIVFGAAFDQEFLVHHICVEDLNGLEKLRGSKYLQSRTEDTFREAKAALNQGRQVLYSGTGCQIAGLKAYLKQSYPNLLTVDILCHGVPSPLLWKRYLLELEHTHGAKAQQINFRNKNLGWKRFSLSLLFSNNQVYMHTLKEDPYMQMFLKNICLRPSCYDCKFKTIHSQADITLGDCWGIEKYMPEIDDDKGISVIFVHTGNGAGAISRIASSVHIQKADFQQVQQSMAYESVMQHPHRRRFFAALASGESSSRLYSLLEFSFAERAVRKLKQLLNV